MRIMWKAITDADVEQLINEYDLTKTELEILQLRRKGTSPIAISMKINYQRSQMYAITAKLAKKIVQMQQKKL